MWLSRFSLIVIGVLQLIILNPVFAGAGETSSCEARHPMDDAWFTGPMLANTAATAPRGHVLIEPYLYDVVTQGQYGANGVRHSAAHENSYGSLTYLIYGLTDRIGIGLIPVERSGRSFTFWTGHIVYISCRG